MSATDQAIAVKDAIRLAKQHATDLFSDDEVRNVGLEEMAYDEASDEWHTTVGFSRPWDSVAMSRPERSLLFPDGPPPDV